MHCFRVLIFCDNYIRLWILTIILSIITTEAKHKSFNNAFDISTHYYTNESNTNKSENIDKKTIPELESESETVQRSQSQSSLSNRPSNVLKKFWSSASKSIDSEFNQNNNNNSFQSIDDKLKDFLFRPIKWSQHIVPSVPLGLQLSSDAINISPSLFNGTKTTTKGDITVINGLISSSISYPPRDYQKPNRNDLRSEQNSETNINRFLTPSYSALKNPNEFLTTLESIKSEISLPINKININTSLPIVNTTNSTRIITTTATIRPPNEFNVYRRLGQTVDTLTATLTQSTTPLISTVKSYEDLKPSEQQLRRQAIKQRFGNPRPTFGSRISQTPPKVSIENFLSVYKPSLKNIFWENTLKNGFIFNHNNTSKAINNTLKANTKPINETSNSFTNNSVFSDKQTDHLITSENRNSLSSLILFPSRPKPQLRPKLSNNSIDCEFNKFMDNLFNFSVNQTLNTNGYKALNSNKSEINSMSERRIDEQLMASIPKNKFGYRRKPLAPMEKKQSTEDPNLNNYYIEDNYPIIKTTSDYESVDGQTYSDLNSEESPEVLSESNQYIPMDQLMDSHKHYMNKIKLQEHNHKYNNIPNPELFKEELIRPEESDPKFGITPIDPNHNNKHSYKAKPTLPNKMMKFDEMLKHLASIMRSINRLTPIGKSLSDKYKQFASKVKSDISTNKSKGPYARYYPPGYYDDIYDPDQVEDNIRRSDDDMMASEINSTYVEPPNNYTFIDNIEDIITDNNNSYVHNDYDDDGLIKKSFGYRVTVYRSPHKGESNVTEELLNKDNDLNLNKSDDLSASESSDVFAVTTDSNPNDTQEMLTSESNLLKSESQAGVKGNAKGVDYKRNKYNRERGSHGREEMNKNKRKKVDTHNRRANNERALKERTIIEFFEREHILDAAFNKDKLSLDKGNNVKSSDDQHTSGSMTSVIKAPEGTSIPIGTLNEGEAHEYANSEQSHVTNGQTFDTVFPDHDRKYKHKDNAHKYKGWKERGYKIITETEFVDRGVKVDTGFKHDVNGSSEHIKEHSAGDVTKGDQRKYRKNIKNLNKNYESLYGNRLKSPENIYESNNGYNYNRDKVILNADNYRKYYNDYNNGITSGESRQREELKPYITEQPLSEELTTLSTINETEINTSSLEPIDTTGFHAPKIDTENLWRPITRTLDHLSLNQDLIPRPKHYYNSDYNSNNVYTNENQNENYDQIIGNDINNNLEDFNGLPTITSDHYGMGYNPYSMPLVSEEVPYSFGSNNGQKSHSQNIPQYYNNNDYYYQSIPEPKHSEKQNQIKVQKQNENSFQENPFNKALNVSVYNSIKDKNIENSRYYHNYYQTPPKHPRVNITYFRATNDDYNGPKMNANYPSLIEIAAPTPEAQLPTNQPYYEYQVFPSVNENDFINDKINERPVIALIDDETRNIPKVLKHSGIAGTGSINTGRTTGNRLTNNRLHINKFPNLANVVNFDKQLLTTPVPKTQSYIKAIKINTRIPKTRTADKNPSLKLKPKQTKKKINSLGLFPTRPLMPPMMDSLLLNSNPIQTLLNPLSQISYNLKIPFGVRTTALPPRAQMSVPYEDTHFSGSDEQPVAILHPNKMLTITTTGLLRNRNGERVWAPNEYINPFRWVMNPVNSKQPPKQYEPPKRLQRSTHFKFNLISPKLLKKRSFKQMFSFKNWLKSKFRNT